MAEKSNTLESIEIGTYIDIANGSLYLSTYLTDFEPDLEGIDDTEFVIFHTRKDSLVQNHLNHN
jgi:hypothetical protein